MAPLALVFHGPGIVALLYSLIAFDPTLLLFDCLDPRAGTGRCSRGSVSASQDFLGFVGSSGLHRKLVLGIRDFSLRLDGCVRPHAILVRLRCSRDCGYSKNRSSKSMPCSRRSRFDSSREDSFL